MEQNSPTRQQGVSAALAAAQAQAAVTASLRFPGEDAGRSLADLAQSDLDAALQLLADRAQYITGASGAAIALRRDGRDDMLCRASVGTNAPELGALLSTEFGLSGESVRTRQLLRCDDAERDARVNREVCREMGIASVLVMPVVDDDRVLGVFELFSGKANAFGERDLSAVQRLSEMVETAVRLAQAAEHLPEQLSARESSVAEAMHPEVFQGQFLSDLVVEDVQQHHAPVHELRENDRRENEHREHENVDCVAAAALESPVIPAIPLVEAVPEMSLPQPQAEPAPAPAPTPASVSAPVNKPLFWSAAVASDDAAQPIEPDQSHVPPMLRGLRKCEACGFPISAGRVLCVECEEKKWRGQLRPHASARKPPSGVTAVPAINSTGPSFAAAAPSLAKMPAELAPPQKAVEAVSKPVGTLPPAVAEMFEKTGGPAKADPEAAPSPEFVLTAGLESPHSWFSANKFILLVLLVIGAGAAVFFLLR